MVSKETENLKNIYTFVIFLNAVQRYRQKCANFTINLN